MFRSIHFNRRKPGMSPAEYRDYYENHHSKLGAEFLNGHALSYTRTYLTAMNPGDPAPIYDSVMMLCFPDRATFDRATGRVLNDPAFAKLFMEDELRLFDRPEGKAFASEDIGSDLPPVPHGDDIYRTIWFGRRRPDMTPDQCRDHYERKHRLLGEYIMGGFAIDYDRHYLHQLGPDRPVPHYDFVTEINFPSRERFDAMVGALGGNPTLSQLLADDEASYVDRSASVHYHGERYETVLDPVEAYA